MMRNYVYPLRDCFYENIDFCTKKNRGALLIILSAFVLGILLGFFFKSNLSVSILSLEFSTSYFFLIFDKGTSVFSIFFIRIVNNLCFFLIIMLLSVHIFLLPVHFLLYAYRGFILGTICVIFSIEFGFAGVICLFFTVIPQHFITQFSLSCLSVKSFSFLRRRKYMDIRSFCKSAAVFFAVSIAGPLIELIMLLCILRPLNFFF